MVAGFSHLRRGLQSTAPATKNEPEANRDNRFVRAWAVEMHMDISQGHFYSRIHNNIKAGAQRAYPDLTPGGPGL